MWELTEHLWLLLRAEHDTEIDLWHLIGAEPDNELAMIEPACISLATDT